jgi:integration host factor subunit beta
MNKSDLIDSVVEHSGLPKKRAEVVVNLIFDAMTEALADGKRIEIRDFGSFISKSYRARSGRNPRTGELIDVPAKRLPFFKVGKRLRERVDAEAEAEAKAHGSGDSGE